MDFLCFYFPLFCIHWLMGNYLLSANLTRNADDIRTDTMGILATPQVGRRMGEMDDKVSDGTFLWSHVVLRRLFL